MNDNITTRRTPLAAAICSILAGTALSAHAQSGDPQRGARSLEEIVVTASRREQNILDIPYNISAISGTEIAANHIIDNADLMRSIPGVAVVDRGYRNAGVINGIMIRGLNVDGAALGDYALNTVPTVSTYVNDTPIFANFILKDIERVEVLRGPQGTLYGSGSLGGTVRYIMNAPDPTAFDATVSGTLSRTDGSGGLNYGVDAVLNVPISDRAAFRVSAGTVQNEGIIDYVNVYELDAQGIPVAPAGVLAPDQLLRSVKDADDVDIVYGHAALSFEPTDQVRLILSYRHQSDEIGGRRQQTVGLDGFGQPYRRYENGSIQLEPSSRDVDLGALEADIDLGFATLTSSTSVYRHKGDSISENTGFYAQNGWLGAYYYNYPRPMAQAVRTYKDEAFAQELRLVSSGDNTVDWVVGAYYRDQDYLSTQQSFLRGFQNWADAAWGPGEVVSDKDFDYSRDENFKDLGIFGELTYHLSDTFRISGGLRYYDNKSSNDTFMAVGLYTVFSIEDSASFKVNENGVLFKLNASWDLNEQVMLYGTISEGFRRGGSNAVPLVGIFAEDPGWLRYDSDSVINYELGLKGSTDRLRYSTAIFVVDWDDIQVNTASSNWGFFTATNGDSARTMGLELELDGQLTDALSFSFGYAYVKAELTSDLRAPTAAAPLIAQDGARLPGTPSSTVNFSLTHITQLAGDFSWTNRLAGYYQSSSRNAINADLASPGRFNVKLDGFGLLNWVSTVSRGPWDASLFVRNITNEEGVTGLFSEIYMGTDPAQNYVGNGSKQFLTMPRTVGVGLNYRF
ncbi:MAG: TonB-dependent receptor [Gammaproteobacteria bacterium]|nr:TonB-dependent receptor [Gammaproteobacteria bacterium]